MNGFVYGTCRCPVLQQCTLSLLGGCSPHCKTAFFSPNKPIWIWNSGLNWNKCKIICFPNDWSVYPHQNSYCACSELICLPKEMTNQSPRTCIHLQTVRVSLFKLHVYTSRIPRLPWSITADRQCVLQTLLQFQSLTMTCLIALIWLKMLFALPLCLPSPLFCFTSRRTWEFNQEKPHGMSQPFFGCLTNRIAQEQHFAKRKKKTVSHVCAYKIKTKTTTAAVISATNVWRESASAISEVLPIS